MSRRHALLGVAIAIVWGLNFVVIEAGLKVFPPLLFVALRFLVLVPFVFVVRRPNVPFRYIAGVGATSGALQFGLLFLSLYLGMPPGIASLIVQIQVVFTIAIAAVVLGERPQWRQLAAAAVAVGGVVLIATTRVGPVIPLGALTLCIAGAAAWATGNVITRIARPDDAVAFLVWTCLIPPAPLLALSLIIEGPGRIAAAGRSLTLSAVLALLYVALLASGFGYMAWAYLLRRYPASTVATISLMVPVVGLASAAIFVRESPSPSELIGAAIVLVGLALALRSARPRPAPALDT
jgi:O-acetylserine/cysteine efflux transporter